MKWTKNLKLRTESNCCWLSLVQPWNWKICGQTFKHCGNEKWLWRQASEFPSLFIVALWTNKTLKTAEAACACLIEDILYFSTCTVDFMGSFTSTLFGQDFSVGFEPKLQAWNLPWTTQPNFVLVWVANLWSDEKRWSQSRSNWTMLWSVSSVKTFFRWFQTFRS